MTAGRTALVSMTVVVLILLGPWSAFAQQDAATITGEVRDPSGAVVPGATVIVTNIGTNISVTTVTNDRGSFTVPSLRPGDYSLTAEAPGFTKTVRSGLTLQVAQVARVDVTLQAGQLSETVQVTGASPLLETQTSSRGSVIDQRKIVELPLNGRDYNQLALLSPGVLPGTPRLASVNFKGVLNVNGNRTFNNVFLLDGVDNISYSNSFRGENVQLVQPSIEALQEFKIQTNAYSAEYGRSSGAVVNATIKSGTNSVRGSLYEFLRNDALDANNYFSELLGAPKPERKRNQFGGAVGGPIVRNRAFWFADYEGLRDLEGIPRVRQVPTAAEKAGLFTTSVVDPFAAGRPEFSRNAQGQWVIPRDRWDPVGAAVVALIPDPNVPGSTIYASTPATDTRQDQFDVRIDHQITSATTFFGRYSFVDTNTFRPSPLPGLGEGSFNDAFGSNLNRSQGLALGLTRIISPTLVADFRFGFSRGNYFTNPPNAGIDGAAQIGLKNVPNDPAIVGGVPKVNIQGFDAVGRHTSTPQFQTPRSWNPRLTTTWSRDAHMIRFGGEFLHVQTKINDLNATVGRMNFENRFTNRAMGDLLLGLPSQLALTSFTVMDQGQDMQFYFIQDDYRMTSRLTLNLGVRYEYATPPREKENNLANFDPATGTMVFSRDGDTFERALIRPDRNNFAPRLGFAYTPAPRWVIRGGYGVFYTHTVRQGREGMLGFNPPYLVDNLLQTSVTRRCRRGVGGALPAGERLPDRSPGCEHAGADRPAARPGSQPAHAVHPAIQRRCSVRADAERAARCRVRGQQGNGAARLPQSESARGHPERQRIAVGGRSAVSRVRRYPVDGESRLLGLQLAADTPGEAVFRRVDRDGQLHVGTRDHRCARSHLDQRRRRRRRHRHVPRAAGQLQPRRRARAGGVRRGAPVRRELHLGAPVGPRAPVRDRLGPDDGPAVRGLAGDRHSRAAERPRADRHAWGGQRAQPRRRTARASEPGWRSGAAGVAAHDRAMVQYRRVRAGVHAGAASVRQRRRGHHARPGIRQFRFQPVEEHPGDPIVATSSSGPRSSTPSTGPTSVRRTSRATRAASVRFSRPAPRASCSSG